MDGQATGGLLRFFKDLPDPRAHNVVHKLHDILVIALCAVVCGADGWAEVEEFGNSKLAWFATFLDLPHGIPSHDTFGRVFERLDPDAFERCFVGYVAALAGASGGKLVSFDGKSLRRSFAHAWDKSGMARLVGAFVAENHLVLGQSAVDAGEGETAALSRLLGLLDLQDATVTVDAVGCQKHLARQIVEAKADYVLAVKGNQPTLHAKVKLLLDEAIATEGFGGMRHGYFEETDGGHGRVEVRRCWVTDEVHHLGGLVDEWAGLSGVGAIECVREDLGTGETSTGRRYFVASLKGTDADALAARFAGAVRGHWGIENRLHWCLDVAFREDERRIRKGHGAENYSRLCRLALNLLRREKTAKVGVHGKRLKAGWDEHYLLKLLTT